MNRDTPPGEGNKTTPVTSPDKSGPPSEGVRVRVIKQSAGGSRPTQPKTSRIYSLAEGNASVVGRNPAVSQYFEAGTFQLGHRKIQQQGVLKNATTEGHMPDSRLLPEFLTDLPDTASQTQVKPEGCFFLL